MTDTYKRKPVGNDDDRFWDPKADIDENKETQIDDSEDGSSWKHPAKQVDDFETNIPVRCIVGQN